MSLETTSEAVTFEAVAALHLAAIDLTRAARAMVDLTGATKGRLADAHPETPMSEVDRQRFERQALIVANRLGLLEALLALDGIGKEK